MSPGGACGGPRAAPGCMEARGRARGVPPGGGGKTELIYILASPKNPEPTNWWLWALAL